MGEIGGAVAAVLSSAFGGTAIGATRYLAPFADPLLIGVLRFGIGFGLMAPIALLRREIWPKRADWPQTIGLGLVFFALFPIVFNAALGDTTAARGALALSTIPLQTMLIAAAFGIEPLTLRKSAGVLIAMAGVALALLSGLGAAPATAWRGDLLMLLAALLMSLASIGSRGAIRRSGPLSFMAAAMAVGTLALVLLGASRGSFTVIAEFGRVQWFAAIYLGIVGGALAFLLWSLGIRHATPTQIGISVTVNPISAALVGAAFLGEPIGWNIPVGLLAVLVGIWVAVVPPKARPA